MSSAIIGFGAIGRPETGPSVGGPLQLFPCLIPISLAFHPPVSIWGRNGTGVVNCVPDINDKIAEWVEERENLDLTIIDLKLAGDSSSRTMESLIQIRSDLSDKIILTGQLA